MEHDGRGQNSRDKSESRDEMALLPLHAWWGLVAGGELGGVSDVAGSEMIVLFSF